MNRGSVWGVPKHQEPHSTFDTLISHRVPEASCAVDVNGGVSFVFLR